MPDGNPLGGLLGGMDGSVEALGKLYGERSQLRRSRTDEHRSRFVMWLRAAELADPDGAIGAKAGLFADDVGDAWSREGGWDTEMLIRAVAATKGTRLTVNPLDFLRGDKGGLP